LVKCSGSSSLRGSLAAILAPATTLPRVFHLILEDKVEIISRTSSASAHSNNHNFPTSRCSALPISNRIVRATHQEHQSGTTTQFNPMAASSVVKWEIMPTIAPSAMFRPPRTRGIVDRGRFNSNHNSSSPETTRLRRVTKVSRTTFVEE